MRRKKCHMGYINGGIICRNGAYTTTRLVRAFRDIFGSTPRLWRPMLCWRVTVFECKAV